MDKLTREARKEKIRKRYQGADKDKIEYIPGKIKEITVDGPKRVAVYARVSTDNLDQTSSIELQQSCYTEMVKARKEWTLVDTYVDEGISGTTARLRPAFQRMLEDCRAGMIDLIVTKSISRFARNIVDCISIIRELRALPLPVGVLFVTEQIYTMADGIEMVLSMLSALAQEESRIKSELMNISVEQRFSKGIFMDYRLLGYRIGEDGSYIIVPKEAEIVKVCFYLVVMGISQAKASIILNQYKRLTRYGFQWRPGAVSVIITNEKYCGDILARKSYTSNYLTHRTLKNRQNRNQYLQLDHHEPIISRRIFIAAAKMCKYHTYLYKYQRELPILYVLKKGLLKGFVTVYKSWPYTLEEYLNASRKAYEGIRENLNTGIAASEYDKYQVVRAELFGNGKYPVLEIKEGNLIMNYHCATMLKIADEFEILFNPVEKMLAVRICGKEVPNRIEGYSMCRGKKVFSSVPCIRFTEQIYSLMDWNAEDKYKIYGRFISSEDGSVIIFDLKEALKFDKSETRVTRGIDAEYVLESRFGTPYSVYLENKKRYGIKYEAITPELVEDSVLLTDEEIASIQAETEMILKKWGEDLNDQD